jgi:hypothetical protein
MDYWVYKCNSKEPQRGNKLWGDWEDEGVFADAEGFAWGRVADNPDLQRPKKGDRVIAHQTDRQRLVGVAEVLGLRKGRFWLRPLEQIGADMKALKRRYEEVAAIPAYQMGDRHAIREITARQAETLLRLARASVKDNSVPKKGWRIDA